MSQVNYMSGTGAGVFIGLRGLTHEHQGNIILINPTPVVKNLFDLLGLTDLIIITQSMASALRAL